MNESSGGYKVIYIPSHGGGLDSQKIQALQFFLKGAGRVVSNERTGSSLLVPIAVFERADQNESFRRLLEGLTVDNRDSTKAQESLANPERQAAELASLRVPKGAREFKGLSGVKTSQTLADIEDNIHRARVVVWGLVAAISATLFGIFATKAGHALNNMFNARGEAIQREVEKDDPRAK